MATLWVYLPKYSLLVWVRQKVVWRKQPTSFQTNFARFEHLPAFLCATRLHILTEKPYSMLLLQTNIYRFLSCVSNFHCHQFRHQEQCNASADANLNFVPTYVK